LFIIILPELYSTVDGDLEVFSAAFYLLKFGSYIGEKKLRFFEGGENIMALMVLKLSG